MLLKLVLLFWLLSCASSGPRLDEAWQVTNPLHPNLTHSTCDLWNDDNGVPHAKAKSEQDAYACFGYLHGRDRAFHLDYIRRAMQGRLAEVLGKDKLQDDFFLRMWDFAERGRRIFSQMPKDAQDLLWAYAYGINRGLEEAMRKGVHEFKTLGYDPEVWSPQDSVGILLLQAFSETKSSFTHDFTEQKWHDAWGDRALSLVTADGMPWDVPVLKTEDLAPPKAKPKLPRMSSVASPKWWPKVLDDLEARGSNNWALAPSWSKSGKAWFANDPHVQLQYPPFWYWAHVSGGDLDVIGASIPGLPIVISGFNRQVAWGLTNSQLNAADVLAVPKEEIANLPTERPTLWFRFGPVQVPYFLTTFRRTPEGYPVLPLEGPEGRAFVVRWTGFALDGKTISNFPAMMRSRSVEEIDSNLASVGLPSWDYIFSDTNGGIGFRAIGLIPKETDPTPFGVRETTLAASRSWPLLSSDEVPHVLNPSRGYVVTANNRPWAPKPPFYSGRAFAHGFRAFRIEEQLKKTRLHDFASQRQIQCDSQIIDGRFMVPRFIKFAERKFAENSWGDLEKRAIGVLKSWDFNGGPECRACGIYQRWLDRLIEMAQINITGIYRLTEAANPDVKFRTAFFTSLTLALKDIRHNRAEEFPPWKELHRGYFEHVTGSSAFESQDWIPTPGSLHSVSAAGGTWKEGYYLNNSGPAQRLLVEMTDPPTGYFVMDGPNAPPERPTLSKAGTSWSQWRDCQFRRVVFPVDWTKVKAETVSFNLPRVSRPASSMSRERVTR